MVGLLFAREGKCEKRRITVTQGSGRGLRRRLYSAHRSLLVETEFSLKPRVIIITPSGTKGRPHWQDSPPMLHWPPALWRVYLYTAGVFI